MGRQALLQIVTFGGGVVLARILTPAEFGLFAIATFLVGTFALLSDFGLAPSFIQRKEELTEIDLRVGFTLQQILTSLVVFVLFAAAPLLARMYPKAPPETVWLVRMIAFNLYLTSWRSMSALQLERQLRYDKLARIEVVEALLYQVVVLSLAITGHGVWSLVWATLAQGSMGTLLVYLAAPWRVQLGFDARIAGSILRFGIPFQITLLTNSVGNWVTPLLVGGLIGPQAVGYLTWASSNGRKPLVLVDNAMRIAFPHFSRIQDDRAEVERTVVRYLTYLLLPAGLWFSVLVTAGPILVRLIYTEKWVPAVPALALFALAMGFDVIGWVGAVVSNSLGLVKFVTRIVLAISVVKIVLSVPLVFMFGYTGVAVGYLIAASLMPYLLNGLGPGAARRLLRVQAWITLPILAGLLAGSLALLLPLPSIARAVLTVLSVLLSYATASWLSGPPWLREAISTAGRPSIVTAETSPAPSTTLS